MRFFSILAFSGFVCSFVVHLSTFFGVDIIQSLPIVWLLHIGIFIFFIPMVVSAKFQRRIKKFWQVFAPMPKWVKFAVISLFAYALINFALFFFLSGGGNPVERHGTYILQNRGQVIRELTAQEYRQQQAYILRAFSGHWMLFYLIPAVYFWYRRSEGDSNN